MKTIGCPDEVDPWLWEGTFEEIMECMKDENKCKKMKEAIREQHMKNVYIAIEARRRIGGNK